MRPIIAIPACHEWQGAGKYYMHQPYVDRIVEAGGIPLLVPHLRQNDLTQVLANANGVLLPGGIDIDASLFGEEPNPQCGELNPLWDAHDASVIRYVMEHDLPLFAICRGIQILNVVAGGTLIQDIASQVAQPIKHSQESQRWHGSHRVQIKENTSLAHLFGQDSLAVNSFHHQAVGTVAPGFRVSAWAADGVIEAIERESGPWMLGVQWHPELMVEKHPMMQRLFDKLVSEANRSVE